MLPDQFIRVSVRGIGREIKEPQLAVEAGDERLGLFRNMRRPAVNDQKNLVLGPDHEPPEKLNEHIGIDAAFLLDHEPHMAARGDRRDQAHAIPRPCTRYNGGLPLPAPGATRMMIRAHVRGVAEVNLSLFPLRQSFDPWEFLLEPLLHQSFVPFQRTMQRLLAGDAELSQKPPDRHPAQRDLEFIFDQRCHHLARPQRKCELELQRILLRHRVVNPLQLLSGKFQRTPKQRFGLQRSPAATPILRQPTIDRRTIDAENISNNFRAFTILNTAHSTLTHRLQCGVIQSARIVCPHAQRESYSRRHVKKSMLTYVLINRRETSAPPYQLITRFLAGSEWTSLALRGSSTTIRSAPRPVSVPPTEVAYRLPPRVVMSSRPVSFAHRRLGKSAAYHSELATMRNCRWSSSAKSPE